MKGSSKGRTAGLQICQEWTARLNRFAEARTPEQKQAVLENVLQTNPGGTLRSLLEAWGYSSSGRGRKAKGAIGENDAKPARERLEVALKDVFAERSPVKSLYPKLSGGHPTSVGDAFRIVAALLAFWPDKLTVGSDAQSADERRRKIRQFAEDIIRELLVERTGGRSREWSSDEAKLRVFKLVDEERVGAKQFVIDAGKREGALIVASSKNILVGPDPAVIVQGFKDFTSEFMAEGNKGILIFVIDAGLLEAGEDQFSLLYNLGMLSTAMTAYALLPEHTEKERAIQVYQVDWSRWRTLASRCCVVMRRPPLVDSDTGELFAREGFDEFVSSWRPNRKFARLEEFRGIARFDSEHILPHTYPFGFNEYGTIANRDLYWDVLVRPAAKASDPPDVKYFIPPERTVADNTMGADHSGNGGSDWKPAGQSGRGRPAASTLPIEDDLFYVIRMSSPGAAYDDAQRAVYMAARGRLDLDQGDKHADNLLAAAALRRIGFEVLPVAVALSLLPRSLYFAAAGGGEHAAEKT